MTNKPAVIEARGVTKRFEDAEAVRDVSFTVGRGTLFACLGLNGAGKTTTINILCGLLRRDGGDQQRT